MRFDYSKLKGRIKEVFGTQKAFAKYIGCTEQTLSAKLSNKSEWSQKEIFKSASALNIDHESIPAYFFVPEVQEFELKGVI